MQLAAKVVVQLVLAVSDCSTTETAFLGSKLPTTETRRKEDMLAHIMQVGDG